MMRSLFSGVAGLRTHQTRMDVIGNNIANVNTTSYKSQSMVFSDLLYQTTQAASGANANTGRGGVNARQIGLGAKTAAISTAITAQGSAQSTNNPFDIMITGESFFVVNNGSENFFTRDGSFTIDGAGNLVMSSTGYKVMGWQTDPETGDIMPDTVSALQVMNKENLTYPPEATTRAYVNGIVDLYDPSLKSSSGLIRTLAFFDNRGYKYTAKFSIHSLDADGEYYVRLDDILDEDGVSLKTKYGLSDISQLATFGSQNTTQNTTLYELDPESVKFNSADATSGEPTYDLKYSMKDVLDGYMKNPVIASSSDAKITATDPAAPSATTPITKATVTGKTTLDADTLQAAPLSLIFNSDGTYSYTTKDANGKLTTSTLNSSSTPAQWQAALQLNSAPTKVTLNSTGSVEIEFEETLNVSTDYAGKLTGLDPDDSTKFLAAGADWKTALGLTEGNGVTYSLANVSTDNLKLQVTKTLNYTGNQLKFDVETGNFISIGGNDSEEVILSFVDSVTNLSGTTYDTSFFYDSTINFSLTSNVSNGGVSTAEMTSGDGSENNIGAGRKNGEMIGIEVGQDGRLTATYDNGQSKLLGQIAVANFANAAGLSKEGENLYSATMNSGEFDGVGDDITATGGKMNSGVLEMSNVDLSAEFTEMITTQRGFQANSRIITTSDTLLEELVNLKR